MNSEMCQFWKNFRIMCCQEFSSRKSINHRVCGNMRKSGDFLKNRKFGRVRDGKDVENKNVLRKLSRMHFLYGWCFPNCLCVCHLGNWLNPVTKNNIIHSFKNWGYTINLKMFPNKQQISGPKKHFYFFCRVENITSM